MPKLIDCIEAVAFDLDGTLIDTAPDLGAAANMMLAILGGRPVPEQRIPALIGAGIDQFVKRVLVQSCGKAPTHALQGTAAALFRNLYAQRLFGRSCIYPGVVETLQALGERGITLFCVTNKESRFALPLLEAAGLTAHISFAMCADRASDRKPSPNMLLAASANIGIEPAQILCVGDSRADIVAARAAGCRVVAVDYGYHQDLPLAELGADGIVSNVKELMKLSVRPQNGTRALRAIA
jgi:phosphoglycolate phosphatase